MYINSTNSRSSSELRDDFRSHRDQIRRMLGLLDGSKRFAYSLWYVPDDAGWPDGPGYQDSDWDSEYLQSAGNAERMTIELRRREDDGQCRQYALGRPDDDPDQPDEQIHYAGHILTVRPTEVFDADEASEIYFHYFQTHTTPPQYGLRPLELG